jgi:hypothetical protein
VSGEIHAALGQFDPRAQLDIVKDGIQTGISVLARLGQYRYELVKSGGRDAASEQFGTHGIERIEQTGTAADETLLLEQRIFDGLKGQQGIKRGRSSNLGRRTGAGSGYIVTNDEGWRAGSGNGRAAPETPYPLNVVDAHGLKPQGPSGGKICRKLLSKG